MPDFVPLVLTIARESRRLSQTALASASGVTQGALSQIEAGLFSPSADVVERLASSLGYPVSLFSVRLQFQQLPITFFRKKAKVAVRDVNAIRARVNLYRLRLQLLMRAREIPDVRIALTNIAKEGLSPEAAAQRLRVYWNVAPGPIADLTALVENSGVLVVPIDFGSASVDGLSLFEPNDTMPPMIFLNPNMPADRWRMTLAHELGHIALHHHLAIPPDHKDMESEAFRFAQEFLMPLREITGHLGHLNIQRLAQLKKHWRVSMAAIVKRAQSLGRLPERQARWLWVQLSRDGRAEPVEIARELPTTVRSLVDAHLGSLGFTQADLARSLHQNLDEFRSEFGVASAHLRLT